MPVKPLPEESTVEKKEVTEEVKEEPKQVSSACENVGEQKSMLEMLKEGGSDWFRVQVRVRVLFEAQTRWRSRLPAWLLRWGAGETEERQPCGYLREGFKNMSKLSCFKLCSFLFKLRAFYTHLSISSFVSFNIQLCLIVSFLLISHLHLRLFTL